MGLDQNKEIIRTSFNELVNKKNLGVLDRTCGPGFYDHNPPAGAPAGGVDAVREGFQRLYRALPDLHGKIDELIGENDRVFMRASFQGTHQGELMGLQPTGKRLTMDVWHLFRIENGKLAEHWGQGDALGLLRQLGATPKQMGDMVQPSP